MHDDKWISLVFIHSRKWKELFESITDEMIYKIASLDNAVGYNPSIISPVINSEKCEDFFIHMAEEKDFVCIIDKINKESLYKKWEKF